MLILVVKIRRKPFYFPDTRRPSLILEDIFSGTPFISLNSCNNSLSFSLLITKNYSGTKPWNLDNGGISRRSITGHWTTFLLKFSTLSQIVSKIPIVWSLHITNLSLLFVKLTKCLFSREHLLTLRTYQFSLKILIVNHCLKFNLPSTSLWGLLTKNKDHIEESPFLKL